MLAVKPPSPRKWRLYYARYKVRRTALIERLGGGCAVEDCRETENLEFDHKGNSRSWRTRDLPLKKRMDLYEAEALQGLLQLLCRSHNAAKSHAWR